MRNDFSVILDDEQIRFGHGEPYQLLDFDGVDIPNAERFSERGPLQHGDSDHGYRLEPRTIPLVIQAVAYDETTYWQRRDELGRIFTPDDAPIGLRWERPDGSARQIDCVVLGARETKIAGGYRILYRLGVSLKANDPTFYQPEQRVAVFGIAAGGDTMTVPTPIPTVIGVSSIDSTRVIAYDGSAPEHPIITLRGPITAPVIDQETTGETLAFVAGTVVGANEVYTIDCRSDEKVVRDQTGAVRNGVLTRASNIDTFHLKPRRGRFEGNNVIRVRGSGLSTNTEVYVYYHDRYITL
jgi:hypothetical protein